MTNREKDASIDYILNHGLIRPQTAYQRVHEMISMLGFRFIFWDTAYSLCFAGLTFIGIFVIQFFIKDGYSYSTTVALTPMLFLLITFFAETTERVSVLYELKQTCRYTIRQITALRVLCSSAAGVTITAFVSAITVDTAGEFFTLLPLCLSMLFLCSFCQLSVLQLRNSKWSLAFVSVLWAMIFITLPLCTNGGWEMFLHACPAPVSFLIMFISAIAFTAQLKKMLMEVGHYAFT